MSTAAPERGWLSRIAPGVGARGRRKRVPHDLWVTCPDTGEMIYRPDLETALWVTPAGHHMRIAPELRFRYTFDDGRFVSLPVADTADDPLHFTYAKPYRASLAAARKATGDKDAIRAAVGRIGGVETVAIVQNFAFAGGSLSTSGGETFVKAVEEAVSREAPVVAFTAAAGARMQESALALMQMARTTVAIQMLRDANLPYVVVLTDPTIGGVTASYAMLGDMHLAERGAVVGFTGRRVIDQTIRETLPDHFQTADFQVAHGMVDRVVTRQELPGVLGSILRTRMMGRNRLPAA
ncbi:MAG TPA: acetyl-CoA carboxylase carboxyltransferase subunit beta [Caulobacteraceae bacterium]|nr:acetyl-CoA carboxylase carboxyltransferase subunit beta [Caulobacteraceae bacterium]